MIGKASDSIYNPIMINPDHFYWKQLSKFMQNISFWAPSLHRKQDSVLQGETYIAI